jgi:hypothetical protein
MAVPPIDQMVDVRGLFLSSSRLTSGLPGVARLRVTDGVLEVTRGYDVGQQVYR